MAFQNVDQLNLGNLLQIVFSDGVRNQISEDYRDWDLVKRNRVGNTAARELRFMFQSSFGPSAIQYRNPGVSGRAFPDAQQATIAEYAAKFKEMNATIELEYNMWDRARKSPEKYAEPLALEIQSKTTASKRRLAADYYGDGTGVVCEVSAATALSGGETTITLKTGDTDRGHIGFLEYGDLLVAKQQDGTASATATTSVFRVKEKNRDSDTAVLELISGTAAAPSANDYLYRAGQPTFPDLSVAISDYGTLTEVIAGLESLAAADGRTIHGIEMSGANKGTQIDAGAQPLDVTYIQKALDSVKVNVGQDRYRWKMMCMAPEAHAALIESRETDRRFQTVEDNKRGIKYFAYQHGNDSVETYTSEYCPKKRLWIKPEAKSSEKVLEYWGSDFETVKAQGMSDFHLKAASGGGYENTIVSYLAAIGVLVCKHPASIAAVRNFTL